jgi:hypothetical protein
MLAFSVGFSNDALNLALQLEHSNIPKLTFDSSPDFVAFLGSDHVFVGVSTLVPHFGHVTSLNSPVYIRTYHSNPKCVFVFQTN